MDTVGVMRLIEMLAAELERPRELSPRVLNYIGGNYDVDPGAIGHFLVNRLPALEDYEIDLILSPAFTPRLGDQAQFAGMLGGTAIPREDWAELIRDLASRPTQARLVTSDGLAHSVPLREVTIERYVHRLRLDGTISESLLDLIDRTSTTSDHPLLKAVARRAIWDTDARIGILARYLANAANRGTYDLNDAVDLLGMVENYKPVDVADLLSRIPYRQEVLRGQINAGPGAKPFFSPRVQEMHGGDRDQRRKDDVEMSAKERELAFLERMQVTLEG